METNITERQVMIVEGHPAGGGMFHRIGVFSNLLNGTVEETVWNTAKESELLAQTRITRITELENENCDLQEHRKELKEAVIALETENHHLRRLLHLQLERNGLETHAVLAQAQTWRILSLLAAGHKTFTTLASEINPTALFRTLSDLYQQGLIKPEKDLFLVTQFGLSQLKWFHEFVKTGSS